MALLASSWDPRCFERVIERWARSVGSFLNEWTFLTPSHHVAGGFILGLSFGGQFAPLGKACEQVVVLPTPMGDFAREQAREVLPADHPLHRLYMNQDFVREEPRACM